MKVLVIGEGAVEHALVWKLSQSRHIDKIYCCPGNIGIAEIAECIDVSPYNFRTLIDFVKYEWIDLTIVGSGKLFLKGIVNAFEKEGCRIVGPHKAAVQCMTSRVFVKNLMRQYRIPTPEYKVFTSYLHAQDYIRLKGPPLVIKPDGSLNDHGVFTAFTIEDAMNALTMIMKDRIFGKAGKHVIVEESLQGEKVSFVTVTDGQTIAPFTDLYKFEDVVKDERGLDVTVIGAYSPTGIMTKELRNMIMEQIMEPLLKALKSEGIHYKGLIFADLICAQKRPYLYELQCCLRDPETQTILPRLKKDFVDLAFSVIEERLSDTKIDWTEKTSLCIVVSSRGYPQEDKKEIIIHGIEKIKSMKDILVFYGGISLRDNKIVAADGRGISIIATGKDIQEAKKNAYNAVSTINVNKMYHRRNIVGK